MGHDCKAGGRLSSTLKCDLDFSGKGWGERGRPIRWTKQGGGRLLDEDRRRGEGLFHPKVSVFLLQGEKEI